jgi:hypothetical protein
LFPIRRSRYVNFGTAKVWACQDEDDVHVGGKTNRATITFEAEMDSVLDDIPEVV